MDNIQVIERAFKLLEAVAQDTSRPHTLSELVQVSRLNPATAARIVRTLSNLGYLEQLGRKTGYVLGRMAFSLTEGNDFTLPLVDAAKPLMENFTDRTGEYICISGLRDGQRVIYHYILSTKPVQVYGPIVHVETPYRSLSGRMLLAGLTVEEQRGYVRKNGMPGEFWPEITDEAQLMRNLSEISKQKRIVDINVELTTIVVSVSDGNKIVAAVGTYLPSYRYKGEHRRTILELLDEMPGRIIEKPKS